MNEKYAERSEAKKKYRTIKRGPKKLNFGASKPGVGGGPGPLGPLLDPLVRGLSWKTRGRLFGSVFFEWVRVEMTVILNFY